MSKKNKKKKINKIIKEVERKREVGFNSLIKESSLTNIIIDCFAVSTEKTITNFIDQWKNKNVRILISTFFTDYMNEDYTFLEFRWNYDRDGDFKFVILIDIASKKNKDKKVSFYILLGDSTDEYKKKGKYAFKIRRTKTYRDPKTKALMENEVEGSTFVDEL